MNSIHRGPERVLDELGAKVVDGLALMVAQTREDLRVYRTTFPGWVAGASERGRLRLKKHDIEGSISTYPTQGALEFLEQEPPALDGLEEIRLIAGYRWNPDERAIGGAVISLRHSKDDLAWMHDLDEPPAGSVVTTVPIVPASGPGRPTIGLASDERASGRETQAGS